MPRTDFLTFGSPDIQRQDIDAVVDVMASGWLGTGPKVTSFENAFAAYKRIDQGQVAALSSCTAALHCSLCALSLRPGDEVITTALTFCATVNAIVHAGAQPVLADIDPRTLTLDPDDVEQRITARTRAIIPVHYAGRPCDMQRLMQIAEKHDLAVVEDCAHALETEYRGQPAGTMGDCGCFSFYVTKNLVTGEGGMVTASSTSLIERIRVMSLHGLSNDAWRRYSDSGFRHYDVVACGFKYNMMDIQAALGLTQLERVERSWLRRQSHWQTYQSEFEKLPLTRPLDPDSDTRHGYHLYTLLIDSECCGVDRDSFLEMMTQRNIGVGVHYRSLAEHPYYQQRFGWRPEDYPHARRIGNQTVSLPFSAALTERDVNDVVDAVRSVVGSDRYRSTISIPRVSSRLDAVQRVSPGLSPASARDRLRSCR